MTITEHPIVAALETLNIKQLGGRVLLANHEKRIGRQLSADDGGFVTIRLESPYGGLDYELRVNGNAHPQLIRDFVAGTIAALDAAHRVWSTI